MSRDTKIREIARMRENALHGEASALKQAKNESITIGEERQSNATIEKMRATGMSEEQIKNLIS